jgi:hypothetical protein
MTDNKNDEEILTEAKITNDPNSSLFQKAFSSYVTGEAAITPGFKVEYAPHKSQGLQSASDMWIDKSRIFDGLSKEKMDLESIKKISRQ